MGHADDSAFPAQPGPAQPGSGGQRYFPDLPPAIDLPAMEHDVLARWQDGQFFERSLEATEGRPLWTFYEGPPTTNGMPGVHHIEARVFKDVFPRLSYDVIRQLEPSFYESLYSAYETAAVQPLGEAMTKDFV